MKSVFLITIAMLTTYLAYSIDKCKIPPIDISKYVIEQRDLPEVLEVDNSYPDKVKANNYSNSYSNKKISSRIQEIKKALNERKTLEIKEDRPLKIIYLYDTVCLDKKKMLGRLLSKRKCKSQARIEISVLGSDTIKIDTIKLQ